MQSISKFRYIYLILFIFPFYLFAGTTGKIAGVLTDKETGEPLIGANIVIQGTYFGASTDLDGQYSILYIPPGKYNVEYSYIGYKSVIISDVRVDIDQTTRLDLEMDTEAMVSEAIVVTAERDFIKKDVATSVVSVTGEEMLVMPVGNIDNVVGLQAGIQGGLSIRNAGASSALFLMDGITLRDPRNNQPVTKLALSSVKEISVERGGFNAEYGQVRSGIVNVVTNEGSKNSYSGSFEIRYAPPGPKYQEVKGTRDFHDPFSYVFRPFYDDAVAWVGTEHGDWDEYTQAQYMKFEGWNEISHQLLIDDNPNNDLTPKGAQRAFMYETRKKQPNDLADYDIDAGFGGPVPFLDEMIGDLRFFSSYRSTRDVLVFPLSRPDYKDYDWTVRLTSDLSPTMNLNLSVFAGKQYTIADNWVANWYPHWPNEIVDRALRLGSVEELVAAFSDFNFPLADINHQAYALKFSQTLSNKSFYEISLENFHREYNIRAQALRDTSDTDEIIPGYFVDPIPYGYWPAVDQYGILITNSDQNVARPRDYSSVNRITLKSSFTSQWNFYNQLKTGIEFDYYNLDFDYGIIKAGTMGQAYDNRVLRNDSPYQFAAFIQNKLETEGFTLNAGLRMDYTNSNTSWVNEDPFDSGFYSSDYDPNADYSEKNADGQIQLSPRLGVSHPISENAKLYFNYGHFKQTPDYERMFRIERTNTGRIQSYGNPNIELARTISYELGFDYLLFNDYLINIAAFYRDITNQATWTTYHNVATGISYTTPTAKNYEDVKGFELTLRRSFGTWFTGFANYTYIVNTRGNFGSTQLYKSPVEQKKWDDYTPNQYLEKPLPQPYARANLNFFTPRDFGTEWIGFPFILDQWNLNVLLDWQEGSKQTFNDTGAEGISYNVKALDYFNMSLRLTKTVNLGNIDLQLFMDMSNVTNELRLWDTGDLSYRRSLHLPVSEAYNNIPGNDKIGEYRKPGVEYQPMKMVGNAQTIKDNDRAIYYVNSNREVLAMVDGVEVDINKKYLQRIDGELVEVSKSRINKVINDKAYIDMPNASTFWFLNPRRIFYGIRLSYNF